MAPMETVAVCVCTYRRPAQLARLLRALAEMPAPPGTVFVIVDNDGSSGETGNIVRAFERSSGAAVSFAIEREPGLSAAGIKRAWSDEAIVFEQISADRASFGWLRRRWYRLGNIGVKCERAAAVGELFPPLAKTLLLAGRLAFYPLFNTRVLTMPL